MKQTAYIYPSRDTSHFAQHLDSRVWIERFDLHTSDRPNVERNERFDLDTSNRPNVGRNERFDLDTSMQPSECLKRLSECSANLVRP